MAYNDEYLEQKWAELEDVAVDENERGELLLANDWWLFEKGTDREDIWKFFDEHHSKGVGWLMNCWLPEPTIKCDECGAEHYISNLREVPIMWKFGIPMKTEHVCDFCVEYMEGRGILTRCEACGEVFYGKHIKINPKNGLKEICPCCGDVWCE